MKREGRTWCRIGQTEVTLEWYFFSRHLLWRIQRGEGLGLAASLLFVMLWVKAEGPWCLDRGWREGRELSLSIHDWAIWWNLWTESNGWSSTTPRWRNGCFHPLDFLLGKQRYSEEVIETREVLVPMPERSYRGTAKLVTATWKRPRWPSPRRMRRCDIDMATKEQIPHPGKGENSWDCGEDATFGLCGPARSIEDGIGNLVASVLTSRRKHGGPNWRPSAREQSGAGESGASNGVTPSSANPARRAPATSAACALTPGASGTARSRRKRGRAMGELTSITSFDGRILEAEPVIDSERSKDPAAAIHLAALMSGISEDYYCAGWLIGLEVTLWGMLQGADRRFGMDMVTEEEIAAVRSLHEQCGGWIVWRERGMDPRDQTESGEMFVTTEEWMQIVKDGPSGE